MIRTTGLPALRLVTGLSVAALFLVLLSGCDTRLSFQGTELSPPQVASPFQLNDQFDQPVALDDLAGSVVVLTFMYTRCPDVCPVLAETLRKAHDSLGDDASDTAFIAISVDPERDTVEEARRFSEEKGMLHRWSFLTGTEEQLRRVWQAYYVAAEPETHTEGAAGYLVGHSAPVYLIDRSGMLRVLHTNLTLDPEPLVQDIRLLLK